MDGDNRSSSSDQQQMQSDDPEIMALLFNTTTGQASDLPTIQWQDNAPCYGGCSYDGGGGGGGYNQNLYHCPATFADDGCYNLDGDLKEPQVVVSSSTAFMPMDFFTVDDDHRNSTQVPEDEQPVSPLPRKRQPNKRKSPWDAHHIYDSKKATEGRGKEHDYESGECEHNNNNNNNNNDNNNTCMRQNSMSSSSEDSATSQEINGGSEPSSSSKAVSGVTRTESNAKTRARHGSATDPQSLYARKRRERINERLRILQKLVPNGTKVDISTMLEEAVQYVKFLQLQIKLLSSDDLWMYAPIAYNGKDIGLDHIKIGDFGGQC